MQNTTVSCLADTAQKNEGVPSKTDGESRVSPTDGLVLFLSYCPNDTAAQKLAQKNNEHFRENFRGNDWISFI